MKTTFNYHELPPWLRKHHFCAGLEVAAISDLHQEVFTTGTSSLPVDGVKMSETKYRFGSGHLPGEK
jgi:hypothetical protein